VFHVLGGDLREDTGLNGKERNRFKLNVIIIHLVR